MHLGDIVGYLKCAALVLSPVRLHSISFLKIKTYIQGSYSVDDRDDHDDGLRLRL
jgi:hypothetical protein